MKSHAAPQRHSSLPSITDWFPHSVLLLLFSLTVYLYSCPLAIPLDKTSSHQKKMGWLFFCLSGIFTPELVNLTNILKLLLILPFRSSECLLTSQSVYLHNLTLDVASKNKMIVIIVFQMDVAMGNCFHCNVSGKTGCFTSVYCSVMLSAKVIFSVCWDHA